MNPRPRKDTMSESPTRATDEQRAIDLLSEPASSPHPSVPVAASSEVTIHTEAPDDPVDGESGSSSSARVEADDEAFMDAWGSLKTYTLNAYSERYSPSIRHDGPNVRTYDADAVDALLARLRPAFRDPAPTHDREEK